MSGQHLVQNSRLDPRVTLATNLHVQPGVYALLIGSGVSTGAGIPTGWGIVEQLVRRLAAAHGVTLSDREDWQAWWRQQELGELGYSSLLEQISGTPAARRQLLAGFFEPDDEERAAGLKVPGPAHHAIAELVASGYVRVIVTTNFDRLIEQALEARGISPHVLSSDAAVQGSEPLAHAPVTILKLHGDYASLDQRNTVEELAAYPAATEQMLARIMDEYGLVVAGWSGDWDTALVRAAEASVNRRYPLYWSSFAAPGRAARALTARATGNLIEGQTADEFFVDLVDRVQAVASVAEPPASTAMKINRLKRALPDPVRHLEVRELFVTEIAGIETWASERPRSPESWSSEIYQNELDAIMARAAPLLELFATGVSLDRDRQHDELWRWVMQRLLDARLSPFGSYTEEWDNLAHFPAHLALRAAVLGALAAGHEWIAAMLSTKPRWSDPAWDKGVERPAHQVLHDYRVLSYDVVKTLPRWNERPPSYPVSSLIRSALRPLSVLLVGEGRANQLLDRMEYRIGLANQIELGYARGPAGGEHIGTFPYSMEVDGKVAISGDFINFGDRLAWQEVFGVEDVMKHVEALDERYKTIRNDW